MDYNNSTRNYSDIINMPHHRSVKHPHMTISDRAAQFAPFSALTGHSDAIAETARITSPETDIGDAVKNVLNSTLNYLDGHIGEENEISVTYFKRDKHKSGGEYITHTGVIRKIDKIRREMIFADGTLIPIADIHDISGTVFSDSDFCE